MRFLTEKRIEAMIAIAVIALFQVIAQNAAPAGSSQGLYSLAAGVLGFFVASCGMRAAARLA